MAGGLFRRPFRRPFQSSLCSFREAPSEVLRLRISQGEEAQSRSKRCELQVRDVLFEAVPGYEEVLDSVRGASECHTLKNTRFQSFS